MFGNFIMRNAKKLPAQLLSRWRGEEGMEGERRRGRGKSGMEGGREKGRGKRGMEGERRDRSLFTT